MIDGIDKKILKILQSNARTSNAEIARAVGLVPSATLERTRKLEKQGAILGYRARLNPRFTNLGLLAFVFVKTSENFSEQKTGESLGAIPEVQEVHHVAGEDCYLVKVRAASTEAMGRLLRDQFGAIPTVISTQTTIVLETVKESSQLPLTDICEDPSHE